MDNKLQKYTITLQCTPVGTKGPECPTGWTPVGYTQPGTCTIGSVPGNGQLDLWQYNGYNRVCKKEVQSTGKLDVDCCSNLYGLGNSVECKSKGLIPYSDTCNNVMQEKCNTNIGKKIYGAEWNGMPFGQDIPIRNGCNGLMLTSPPDKTPGIIDDHCNNYLRHAPANNYFRTHTFQDYPHDFPRHSYTTPAFNNSWGYYPQRKSYKPYTDLNKGRAVP